jgi:hypothetical protein
MFSRRFLYATLASAVIVLFHASALAQSYERSEAIKDITSLGKELKEKEKLFLSPSDEDQAKFAEFLKQPETGLIRILPRGLYDNRLTISGGGAYYSFALLTHEYGRGSDIVLEMDKYNSNSQYVISATPYRFHTGIGGVNYGFIVTLGDVPIEEVTLGYDKIKYLVDYRPPSKEPEARAEQRRASSMIQNGQFERPSDAPVHVNRTYALRSINYNKSDVLVAFRVVRQETDGSVVLLWKTLKRFSTPTLVR